MTDGGTGAREKLSKVQCPSGPRKQMGAALEKDMGTKACDLQVQRRGRQGDRLQRQLWLQEEEQESQSEVKVERFRCASE